MDLSFARFLAVLRKEWLVMRRDPATIGLTVALPLIQLFLFGYALNTNPRHLPTAVLSADESRYVRTLESSLHNTGYFALHRYATEAEAELAMRRGEVLFVLSIPPNFGRDIDRGAQPRVLMAADATDPTAIAYASAALSALNATVMQRDLPAPLRATPSAPPFGVVFHARYNPEYITALNIVPGLIGTILTLSTLMLTALSMTREREAGTMENLLAMPVRPLEVMMGKIIPYVGLGYVQVLLILAVAFLVFQVPVEGSVLLLLVAMGVFILCNLALGFLFSSAAATQMQALQMTQFFFLPSMLLSGFIFPFHGMPAWARWVGEALPLTHAIRIARGVLLKGNGMAEIWPDAWPMALFALAAVVLAVRSFRETLD